MYNEELNQTIGDISDQYGPYHQVIFDGNDCRACPARSLCTRNKIQPRRLRLQPRVQYEALQRARQLQATEAGRQLYNARAGIEGTISQGVRGFGLRQSRYWGLAKTHLQHLATAAAINIDRLGGLVRRAPAGQNPHLPFRHARTPSSVGSPTVSDRFLHCRT